MKCKSLKLGTCLKNMNAKIKRSKRGTFKFEKNNLQKKNIFVFLIVTTGFDIFVHVYQHIIMVLCLFQN